MRNHYVHITSKANRPMFATAGESILFSMFQPDELITFETLLSRYNQYCHAKRDECRGLRTDAKTIDGDLKLLVAKGYVKELPGEAVERLVSNF